MQETVNDAQEDTAQTPQSWDLGADDDHCASFWQPGEVQPLTLQHLKVQRETGTVWHTFTTESVL